MGASSAQCTMGASRAHSPPFGTPLLSCDTYFLTRWTTHNYSIFTETHPAPTIVMYGGQCGLSVAEGIFLHPLPTSLVALPCLSSHCPVSRRSLMYVSVRRGPMYHSMHCTAVCCAIHCISLLALYPTSSFFKHRIVLQINVQHGTAAICVRLYSVQLHWLYG